VYCGFFGVDAGAISTNQSQLATQKTQTDTKTSTFSNHSFHKEEAKAPIYKGFRLF